MGEVKKVVWADGETKGRLPAFVVVDFKGYRGPAFKGWPKHWDAGVDEEDARRAGRAALVARRGLSVHPDAAGGRALAGARRDAGRISLLIPSSSCASLPPSGRAPRQSRHREGTERWPTS